MSMVQRKGNYLGLLNSSLWDLPSPVTMTYFWNFGSTLGFCLIIQIITGFFLTLHYTSFAEESFQSVIGLMRDVWSGWLIRLIHMNGASVFFLFMYLHLARGLYFMSFTHSKVWLSGVTIMILLMAISFLGYVLPWGQMSYWAVAVITNLFSVVPMIGEELVKWIWGNFSVSSPTLVRFYSFHFILPFAAAAVSVVHLASLHEQGSSNPMGTNSNLDKVEFHPYLTIKDVAYIIMVTIASVSVTFFYPYILGDPVNNIPANAMQTPAHIQPEWYFLTSYAILRSLPSKTAGVLALAMSVAMFYLFPMFNFKFSSNFSLQRTITFWVAIASFWFLMIMGSLPAEEPYVWMSQVGAIVYFTSVVMTNI